MNMVQSFSVRNYSRITDAGLIFGAIAVFFTDQYRSASFFVMASCGLVGASTYLLRRAHERAVAAEAIDLLQTEAVQLKEGAAAVFATTIHKGDERLLFPEYLDAVDWLTAATGQGVRWDAPSDGRLNSLRLDGHSDLEIYGDTAFSLDEWVPSAAPRSRTPYWVRANVATGRPMFSTLKAAQAFKLKPRRDLYPAKELEKTH